MSIQCILANVWMFVAEFVHPCNSSSFYSRIRLVNITFAYLLLNMMLCFGTFVSVCADIFVKICTYICVVLCVCVCVSVHLAFLNFV